MRLIDADALIKVLSEQTFCCTENSAVKKGVGAALKYCNDIIGASPTITAEQKHGRWMDSPTGNETYKYCSECGGCFYMPSSSVRYCPYCGARMDGGAENGAD